MLAVALLVTESGNAQMDGYPQFKSKRTAVNAPQKYCGKKLSNALQILCDGVYNSMFKKSGHGEFKLIIGKTFLVSILNNRCTNYRSLMNAKSVYLSLFLPA